MILYYFKIHDRNENSLLNVPAAVDIVAIARLHHATSKSVILLLIVAFVPWFMTVPLLLVSLQLKEIESMVISSIPGSLVLLRMLMVQL